MISSAVASAVAVVIAAVVARHAVSGRRRAVQRGSRLGQAPGWGSGVLPAPPGTAGVVQGPPPQADGFFAPPRWVASALADADLSIAPRSACATWLVSVAVVAVAATMAGGAGAASVAVGAGFAGPMVAWRLLRRRSGDRFDAALPGAVDAVTRALRSGASLRLAITEAAVATPGRLGMELASVSRAMERGASVVVALEAWAERQPTAGVRLVVSALCLGVETGGALARAVDGVASTLRQRLAARAEAKALATQARASAVVLSAAPLAFTAVASLADPRTSNFLFRTPTGLACLAGGLTLDAAGALWMARLTRIEID